MLRARGALWQVGSRNEAGGARRGGDATPCNVSAKGSNRPKKPIRRAPWCSCDALRPFRRVEPIGEIKPIRRAAEHVLLHVAVTGPEGANWNNKPIRRAPRSMHNAMQTAVGERRKSNPFQTHPNPHWRGRNAVLSSGETNRRCGTNPSTR